MSSPGDSTTKKRAKILKRGKKLKKNCSCGGDTKVGLEGAMWKNA
jgi:hypothetical protein